MQYAASNKWVIEQPMFRVLLTSLRVDAGSKTRSSLHVFPTALCEIRNGRAAKGICISWSKGGQEDEDVKTYRADRFKVWQLLQELDTCIVPIFTRTTCGTNRAEGQIVPFCPPR